jgi:hypothetical protein
LLSLTDAILRATVPKQEKEKKKWERERVCEFVCMLCGRERVRERKGVRKGEREYVSALKTNFPFRRLLQLTSRFEAVKTSIRSLHAWIAKLMLGKHKKVF